jgi:hypothetical protein
MQCRKCGHEFEEAQNSLCPACGRPADKGLAGLLKTSTILISANNTDAVYRSLKEVPEPLRKKLLRSTNSLNAQTILIADRRGRQEIERAMRKLPGAPVARPVLKITAIQVIGFLLSGATGLLAWLILTHHW